MLHFALHSSVMGFSQTPVLRLEGRADVTLCFAQFGNGLLADAGVEAGEEGGWYTFSMGKIPNMDPVAWYPEH